MVGRYLKTLARFLLGCSFGLSSQSALADLLDLPEPLESPAAKPESAPKEPTVSPPASPSPSMRTPPPRKPPPPRKNPGQKQPHGAATGGRSSPKTNAEIRFSSDGLSGNRETGQIRLLQNVVVTQADLELKSDNADVFFVKGSNEVARVVASGGVQILKQDVGTGQKLRASGLSAEFFNSEQKILLRGKPAEVFRGDEIIRGRQFTYDLTTGWIKADTVEGVLQPGDDQ